MLPADVQHMHDHTVAPRINELYHIKQANKKTADS